MLKHRELTDPSSCMSRAHGGEMVFVLLARDRAAPWCLRFWCVLRWCLRKNKWSDQQIQGALLCARVMTGQRLLKDSLDKAAENRT